MFATKAGEVATDVVDVPGGSAIVAVDEIIARGGRRPDTERRPRTAVAQLDAQPSCWAPTRRRCAQRYTVSVNQAVLAQLMEQKSQ